MCAGNPSIQGLGIGTELSIDGSFFFFFFLGGGRELNQTHFSTSVLFSYITSNFGSVFRESSTPCLCIMCYVHTQSLLRGG